MLKLLCIWMGPKGSVFSFSSQRHLFHEHLHLGIVNLNKSPGIMQQSIVHFPAASMSKLIPETRGISRREIWRCCSKDCSNSSFIDSTAIWPRARASAGSLPFLYFKSMFYHQGNAISSSQDSSHSPPGCPSYHSPQFWNPPHPILLLQPSIL